MTQKAGIDFFRDKLEQYTYFDKSLDQISSSQKQDGSTRHVYLTDIKEAYLTMAQDHNSIIIKELSKTQAEIYQKLSSTWNPYLETIYGILEQDGHYISINEFIEAPKALNCETRSLSLEEYVTQYGCFSEQDALFLLLQLCSGVKELQNMNLTHGDISPQNILLTDALKWQEDTQRITLKIIDFDITKQKKQSNHEVTTVLGTGPFAAPEILDYRYPSDKVDLYSLGCILHYMITGSSPKNYDYQVSKKQISRGTLRIIKHCTAGYEVRCKNAAKLEKEILHQLHVAANIVSACIYSIPGFRSGTFWKMLVACYFYISITIGCILSPQKDDLMYSALFVMEILFVFDVFHLGDLSMTYTYLKSKLPFLKYLVKCMVGFCIFFVFCLITG